MLAPVWRKAAPYLWWYLAICPTLCKYLHLQGPTIQSHIRASASLGYTFLLCAIPCNNDERSHADLCMHIYLGLCHDLVE